MKVTYDKAGMSPAEVSQAQKLLSACRPVCARQGVVFHSSVQIRDGSSHRVVDVGSLAVKLYQSQYLVRSVKSRSSKAE